ncbi:hypothetical protein [Salinivibrio kushneri]|uniref:Uncharacterized protein n=1 Tax=Salinivibrio kushneri TaxID=1908198 RepID=A0AA47LQV5_9GAMM|nr:hypothetical protein [Salinivibrio kushneri]WBA08174.1 hypothetical protein N8M53_10140 [Salinivibrio kushneri]
MNYVAKCTRDQGIATLAVVASIALIALLIVLGVGRRTVNDIQQTQAKITTEQSLSRAWAALDCAVAKIEHDGIHLSKGDAAAGIEQLSSCQHIAGSQLWLEPWQDSEGALWHLYATHAQQQVGVTLAGASGGRASSFVTSGSAAFYGGNIWRPAKGKKRKDGLYECHSIIAGGDVMIRPRMPDESPPESEEPDSPNGFTVSLGGGDECAPEYKTKVSDYTVADSRDETGARLKKDVQTNVENMDLFKDYFGVPRAQWKTVRDQFERQGGIVVNTHHDPSLCYETLLNAMNVTEQAHAKIWIDGPCDLSRVYSDDSENAAIETQARFNNQKPILLVVQDGILALRGALSQFNGVVFQFNPTLSADDFAHQWGMEATQQGELSCVHSNINLNELCTLIVKHSENPTQARRTPFWFHGSFQTHGGFIVDIPGGHIVVNGSFKPNYNGNHVRDSFEGLGLLRPLYNSYHDIKPPHGEG